MPDIGNYTEAATLFLVEGAKYFLVLLLSILAIRLWRRWIKIEGTGKGANLVVALVASGLALAAGWVFMNQSLAKLYSYYGMRAFRDARLPQAAELFDVSLQHWKTPDALGEKGVCLLLLGGSRTGLTLLDRAREMRGGRQVAFEDFYEGLYYFTLGQPTNSVPHLEASLADYSFRWDAVKLLAITALDVTNIEAASQLMQPYTNAEVTRYDQAYIVASIEAAAGQKAEALAVVDKFAAGEFSPAWQARFTRLRKELKPRQ